MSGQIAVKAELIWNKTQKVWYALQSQKALGRFITLLLAALIFGFVGLSFYRNWDKISQYEWQINYANLFLGLAAQVTTIVIAFCGWHLIIKRLGGDIRLRKDAKIYLYTAAGKYIPGTLWYIAGRVYLFKMEGIPKTIVLTSTALEMIALWISGVVAYFLLFPFYSYTFLPFNTSRSLLPILIATLLIFVAFTTRPSRLFNALNFILARLGRAKILIDDITHRDVLIWLAVYLSTWIVGGVAFFCIVSSVYPLSVTELPNLVGFSTLFALVGLVTPFLPVSIGIREVSAALLLTYYVPFPVGMAFSLLFKACTVAADLLLAILSRAL